RAGRVDRGAGGGRARQGLDGRRLPGAALTDDEDPAPDTAAVRRDGGRRLPLLRLAPDPEIAGEDGLAEEEVAVMVRERVQHVGPRRDRRDERPDLLGGRAPGTLLQRPGQDHGLAPTVEEPD